MARIDRSSQKSPIVSALPLEKAPVATAAVALVSQAPGGDDYGSKPPPRFKSGRYPSVVRANPKLAEEFASQTAAARAGLLAVKSGSGGAATKGFTPAGFAKSLEGKSLEQAGEAFSSLEPKQQDTVKTALLKGTLKSPQLAFAVLNGLAPKDQQAFLKKLPGPSLDALKGALRAEPTPTKAASVIVAVSIELAGRTKWAEKNRGPMEALRKTHADMKLMGGEKDGLGSFRDGTIKYADKLLKSPEALAATLAHEGVHAHQGSSCCGGAGPTSPQGEAQGMAAGAEVWGQLQPKGVDDRLEANNLAQLNKYTKLVKSGPGALLKEVITQYLQRAEQKVAERKNDTRTSWATGDTASDWEKYVTEYKKKLETLK